MACNVEYVASFSAKGANAEQVFALVPLDQNESAETTSPRFKVISER